MTKNEEKKEKKSRNLRINGISFDAQSCVCGLSLVLSGVVCIKEYSADSVLVMTRRGSVVITGNELEIAVFEGILCKYFGRIAAR